MCQCSLREHHRECSVMLLCVLRPTGCVSHCPWAVCPENHRLGVTPLLQIHVFTNTFIPRSACGDTINSSQRPVSLSEEHACKGHSPLNWGKCYSRLVRTAYTWLVEPSVALVPHPKTKLDSSLRGLYGLESVRPRTAHPPKWSHSPPMPRSLSFALMLGWSS